MSEELQKLIQLEKANISIKRLAPALAQFYVELGGSLDNVKKIASLASQLYAVDKMQKSDLPGPESLKPYIIPTVSVIVAQSVAQLLDDLTQGKKLLDN